GERVSRTGGHGEDVRDAGQQQWRELTPEVRFHLALGRAAPAVDGAVILDHDAVLTRRGRDRLHAGQHHDRGLSQGRAAVADLSAGVVSPGPDIPREVQGEGVHLAGRYRGGEDRVGPAGRAACRATGLPGLGLEGEVLVHDYGRTRGDRGVAFGRLEPVHAVVDRGPRGGRADDDALGTVVAAAGR